LKFSHVPSSFIPNSATWPHVCTAVSFQPISAQYLQRYMVNGAFGTARNSRKHKLASRKCRSARHFPVISTRDLGQHRSTPRRSRIQTTRDYHCPSSFGQVTRYGERTISGCYFHLSLKLFIYTHTHVYYLLFNYSKKLRTPPANSANGSIRSCLSYAAA